MDCDWTGVGFFSVESTGLLKVLAYLVILHAVLLFKDFLNEN